MLSNIKKLLPVSAADKALRAQIRENQKSFYKTIHQKVKEKATVYEKQKVENWLKVFHGTAHTTMIPSGMRGILFCLDKEFGELCKAITDLFAEHDNDVCAKILASENNNVSIINKNIINYDVFTSDLFRNRYAALEKRFSLHYHALIMLRTHDVILESFDVDLDFGNSRRLKTHLDDARDLYSQLITMGKTRTLHTQDNRRIDLGGEVDAFEKVSFVG